MICEDCISLQNLVNKGLVTKAKCPSCANTNFTKKSPVLKPVIFNNKPEIKANIPKPPRTQITQKHYDNLYNKYVNSWGLDKTIAWLNNKFKVID